MCTCLPSSWLLWRPGFLLGVLTSVESSLPLSKPSPSEAGRQMKFHPPPFSMESEPFIFFMGKVSHVSGPLPPRDITTTIVFQSMDKKVKGHCWRSQEWLARKMRKDLTVPRVAIQGNTERTTFDMNSQTSSTVPTKVSYCLPIYQDLLLSLGLTDLLCELPLRHSYPVHSQCQSKILTS